MGSVWDRYGFSWSQAIEANRAALIAIVAAIFRMLDIDAAEDEPKRLPRVFHRRLLRLLSPAESACRRLIFIAARDLAVKPAPARASRPVPQGLRGKGPGRSAPAFQLYDPRIYMPELVQRRRRRFAKRSPYSISVLGPDPHLSPLYARPAPPPPPPPPPDDGMVNALPLRRRLEALQLALGDLPAQARRLVRWRARRRQRQQAKRWTFDHPLRPGLPPGYRKKPVEEVDHILLKCHAHAFEVMRVDTS
jgi:hypothetical protein